jgi:DNA-binding MarR family transcriptional regulator
MDFKLYYLLHHAENAVYKARYKELSQYGVTVLQSAILFFIVDNGEQATIKALAHCTSKHPNTISRQIKMMEALGLVKKNKSEGNQQPITYSLTHKGEKTYKETIKCESIHRAMSLLSLLERHALESYLIKVWEKSVNPLR